MQFKLQTLRTVLLIVFCLIASFDGYSQMKLGYHYKIKNKSWRPLYYKIKVQKIVKEVSLDTTTKKEVINLKKVWVDSITKKQMPVRTLWIDARKDTKRYDNSWFYRNKYEFHNWLQPDKLRALIEPDSNKLKVVFWSIPEGNDYNDTTSKEFVNSKDSADAFYYEFKSRKKLRDVPKYYISLPFACTEIGAISVPFKFRFAHGDSIPNDLSTDFNAGLYIGRKWGRTRFYENKDFNHNSINLTLAAFAAPTQITVEKDNTEGRVTKKANELGISGGIGLMIDIMDGFNLGLFGGVDFPITGKSYYWDYANRVWVGFGIGYKLKMFGAKE